MLAVHDSQFGFLKCSSIASSPFMKATFTTNYTFTPLAVFIVLSTATAMEKTIESATEIEETESYMQLSFSLAPKKNQRL
jgi:hypothetical protein